ncbi:hypothetical protein CRE_23673 [Caenorhabditis remanei]|uniref:Uncharacterized protein n=1 Tax=Caenorhabditis remanei TaxID=31234 RepID=E3N492_CAERE|nr:hypothetical protein CRE_23673 [Caenorhabditis remanei]
MDNSTLKRSRESSSGRQSPVSSRRCVGSSERSTTSEVSYDILKMKKRLTYFQYGLPDMKGNDQRIDDDIEKNESREVSSGSDREDGNDERKEDEDQEVSKKKDERDEDDSVSDENDEITVPRRFPWLPKESDDEDDEEEEEGKEEEEEEQMKQDEYYNKLVETIDEEELNEDRVKAIWKFVKGGNKRFAHIIGLTLYETKRQSFDHYLCEEMVERAVQFWNEHGDLSRGDDEQSVDDMKEALKKLEEPTEKGEENTPSDVREEFLKSITYSSKKLRFKMLDGLIEADKVKKDIDEKKWFLKELSEWKGGYEKVIKQRADRAWEIVRTFGSGVNYSIGAAFYFTARFEIDLKFLEEVLEKAFIQFGWMTRYMEYNQICMPAKPSPRSFRLHPRDSEMHPTPPTSYRFKMY